jgi:hypothetical protein
MRILTLTAGLLLLIGASSCLKDRCEATRAFIAYEPVWATSEELLDIGQEPPRPLDNPGKIYLLGDLLFVNELWEGVHIFDNSNPGQPQAIGFLRIPGNVDIAIRNGLLYADNGPHLVALDLTQPAAPELVYREEGVFQNRMTQQDEGFLLYYEQTDEVVEVACNEDVWLTEHWTRGNTQFFSSEILFSAAADALNAAVQTGAGTGGSLARFTIMGDHLYAIDQASLYVYDLKVPASPQRASTVNVGWGIETVFPVAPNLFIGAEDGMYIFDASNPLQPVQLSVFEHALACDPVFMDGDIAYVTLRDGNECRGFVNQLDVVDISKLTDPRLLASYAMHNPIGLSVADEHLYLCDNQEGLKVFEVSPWQNIGQGPVGWVSDFTAVDVITVPAKQLAIVVGPAGIEQFDISEPAQARRLSTIPIL